MISSVTSSLSKACPIRPALFNSFLLIVNTYTESFFRSTVSSSLSLTSSKSFSSISPKNILFVLYIDLHFYKSLWLFFLFYHQLYRTLPILAIYSAPFSILFAILWQSNCIIFWSSIFLPLYLVLLSIYLLYSPIKISFPLLFK